MGQVDHIWRGKTRLERFLEKVVPDEETGCWWWTASFGGDGYGQFGVEGGPTRAHRFLIANPKGMQCHHICGNRDCVRPDHIEFMSPRDHARLHNPYKCEHGGLRRNARGDCLECDRIRSRRRREDPVYREREQQRDRERKRRERTSR